MKRNIAHITLGSVYQQINLDGQSDIPLIIRLLENPASPIALPGKITLHNHDCLHIILGVGVSSTDEAFYSKEIKEIRKILGIDRQDYIHLIAS